MCAPMKHVYLNIKPNYFLGKCLPWTKNLRVFTHYTLAPSLKFNTFNSISIIFIHMTTLLAPLSSPIHALPISCLIQNFQNCNFFLVAHIHITPITCQHYISYGTLSHWLWLCMPHMMLSTPLEMPFTFAKYGEGEGFSSIFARFGEVKGWETILHHHGFLFILYCQICVN